jgi:uncharacterized protein (TIRG00374 family)
MTFLPRPPQVTAPAGTGPSPWKVWGLRLLKAGIAALTLVLTWRFLTQGSLDWTELGLRLRQANPAYLLLGLLLLLGRWNLWDWRFRLASREAAGKGTGAVLGFFVLVASAALNLITPTARVIGGLVRARYFARAEGRPFGLYYGVVLWDQVAYHGVMAFCTWVTFIGAAFYMGREAWAWSALALLALALLLLALWIRRGRSSGGNPLVRFLARRAEQAEGAMQKVYAHGHEAVGVFVRLLGSRKLALESVLLGVPYFLVNAGGLWAMFLALGDRVNPFVVLAVVALGTAAGTLSGTPGGLGTTEVAMLASFRALGVDPVTAAAGTLLYRGLHYGSILLLGLPALAVFELRSREEPGEESEDLAA